MKNNKKTKEQLLDIAYKLSSSLNLQFILNKITEKRTLRLLSTKRAAIYLLDRNKEFLKPAATLDPSNESQVMTQKIDVKTSLSGKVVKAKKGKIFNNASKHSDAYQIPGTPDDEDENLLVLPLMVEKEVLGTLNLYRRRKLYLKEDAEFAEIFALYAGAAIQNALEHQSLVREIEEHKQAEEALKSSEARLKIIFELAPDAIYLTDLKGTFIDGNKTAENILGYKKEELIGKSFLKLKLLPAKELLKASKLLMKNVQGKGTGPDEFLLNRKDSNQILVEISTYPVKIKNKKLILGIARDISDRKRAENALRDANSLKETLLDVIAHDLKNPAGVIKGFAEFGLENDPNSEILKEINGGADNLLNVINSATILSKVAIGDTIEKEELNLVNIINSIIKENTTQLQYEEMTINMKLKGKLIVNANPIISEVFRNYISNAIKYAKNGKKIIIDAIMEDGFVIVNVKDFGKTIEKKDLENIFIRNVQLDKTKGRGLGLAIVKRIAEAHDAEVGVKPNKPTGNIFYIKLPVS